MNQKGDYASAVVESPLLLSVADAARLLGIGERHCWDLIAAREIRSVKLGQRRLVPRAEIERIATSGGGR